MLLPLFSKAPILKVYYKQAKGANQTVSCEL